MCWEGKKQLKKQGGENKTKCVEMNKVEQHAPRERSLLVAFPSSACTWVVTVSEPLPTAAPSWRFSHLALRSHPQGPAGYHGQAQHLMAPRASVEHQ